MIRKTCYGNPQIDQPLGGVKKPEGSANRKVLPRNKISVYHHKKSANMSVYKSNYYQIADSTYYTKYMRLLLMDEQSSEVYIHLTY